MTKLNEHLQKLPGNYLFSEVARRVSAVAQAGPERPLLRLGIGDVTRPLVPAVVEAMKRAVEELGREETFRGYGPEQGYPFLREAIARQEYQARGAAVDPEEIYVSDGAKSDCGSIGELFGGGGRVAVCDPVYPVYVDAHAMAGRGGDFCPRTGTWDRLVYLPCTAETGFLPQVPEEPVDLVCLCSPNNPTGAAADRETLRRWVDYANETGAVLLFDAAYEAFITDPALPHSIFEIEGARTCAIEFRSFSKTAGFTGVRCAWTVIPRELEREGVPLGRLWARWQAARFNGASYIAQRGAEAVYTPEGRAQVRESIAYYQRNARTIRAGLAAAGLAVSGGEHAPYVWARTPGGMDSWTFFDELLRKAGVVVTPGVGFGPGGEGYIRLSAFGSAEEAAQAVERLTALL